MSTAVITGTSRGLGRALAERLLAEGWSVHGFSRSSGEITHPRFTAHAVDISDEGAVRAAVDQISDPIDLLVNNAGAASLNAMLLTPGAVAAALMRVNYLGAFHCLQSVGKAMVRQRRGLVINITTVAVPLSLEGEAAYVASKAALDALTKVAAAELAHQGVRVIGLGFGPLTTGLTRAVPAFKLAELDARLGRPQGTSLPQAVDFIIQHLPDASSATGTISYLARL